MLTFKKKGRAIAKIMGGKDNNKIIFLDINEEKKNATSGEEMKYIIKGHECPICGLKFTRRDSVTRHINTKCKKENLIKKLLEDYMNENYTEKEIEDIKGIKIKRKEKIQNKDIGREIIIKDEGKIIPLPNTNNSEVLYIGGPRDSGKSYYTTQYIKEFQKCFPDKDIFLFSRVEEDGNLDKIEGITRIKLDMKLLKEIDTKETLNNSICIFDDIDTGSDKKICEKLIQIRDDVIKCGRDQKNNDARIGNDIYCVCTNHQITDYKKTRDLLNECTSITVFPKSGSTYGITRALKLYCGLSKNNIERILSLPSRWVTIYRRYPIYCIYEKGCYLLN